MKIILIDVPSSEPAIKKKLGNVFDGPVEDIFIGSVPRVTVVVVAVAVAEGFGFEACTCFTCVTIARTTIIDTNILTLFAMSITLHKIDCLPSGFIQFFLSSLLTFQSSKRRQ